MPKTEQPKGRILTGTPKQELAAELLSENIRNRNPEPIGKVLRRAGYSEEISLKPKLITSSDTFQALLDKKLNDKMLVKKHKSLLNAANVLDSYIFSNSLTDAEIKKIIEEIPGCKFIRTQRNQVNAHAYFYKPDNGTQYKSLELAYRIKRRLGSEAPDGDEGYTEEIKAVIVRIRKVLPQAGQ